MAEALIRKCACCKRAITIDENSINDVIQYKGKYYHLSCFETMATEKAASKRGKSVEWQAALDNLQNLKNETRGVIEHSWAKDDLNDWLLQHYDISAVPSRFWQIIAELEQGKYKGKKCKPIKIGTILGAWRWGQRKLDEIALTNKKNNKGPKSDNDRIMYDFAILIQKVPQFLAYQEKQRMAEMERQKNIKDNTKVDYSKIITNNKQDNSLRDISSLVDSIF